MNLKSNLREKLEQTIQLLHQAYSTYKPEEIFLSFNGGKDCTVLLDITIRLLGDIISCKDIQCVYMQPMEPFEEVEDFIGYCKKHYGIEIRTMKGGIKTILQQICDENPDIKACLMGSRRTDPYCNHLQLMQETDSGWPKLMRISPLLDWNCTDIWDYIQSNEVHYCSLYDRGYTSIGDRTNTIPNPNLKRIGKSGELYYLPAYHLGDADKFERAGRLQ